MRQVYATTNCRRRQCSGGRGRRSRCQSGRRWVHRPAQCARRRGRLLKVFCTEWDTVDLTHHLGSEFATLKLCLKRFPVHMTAQTAVQAILELQAEHGSIGAQVDRVIAAGNERVATVNNIPDPTDIMMAQYSIPFCVALALFRDPRNPALFDESAISDADIRAMCKRVAVTVAHRRSG